MTGPPASGVVGRAQGAGDVDPGRFQDSAHGGGSQRGGGLLSGVGICGGYATAQTGDAHPRQLGAYAQEPGLAPT